jgi:hypothetical protein
MTTGVQANAGRRPATGCSDRFLLHRRPAYCSDVPHPASAATTRPPPCGRSWATADGACRTASSSVLPTHHRRAPLVRDGPTQRTRRLSPSRSVTGASASAWTYARALTRGPDRAARVSAGERLARAASTRSTCSRPRSGATPPPRPPRPMPRGASTARERRWQGRVLDARRAAVRSPRRTRRPR